MGLVFFICCRSHFLPSGGLLKSQMLLLGWVVSESGSRLEMQWGGDTCWRIFKRAFGLLEWGLVILLKCEGDPPLLPWIPARWDRQPWSWGLDAGCSRRAAAGRVVGQAMLADRWIVGQKMWQKRLLQQRSLEGKNIKKGGRFDSCPLGVSADSCPAGAPWLREWSTKFITYYTIY